MYKVVNGMSPEISQGAECNISLNRHVRCTFKSNRMSIPFWNHQTFYFKDYWVWRITDYWVRNTWSISWILSMFALHSGFWVALWTYCNLKMSTLFRFYKYFTNDFNTKYLLVNNLHLSDILVISWLLLSPVKPLNPNKVVSNLLIFRKRTNLLVKVSFR